MKIFHCNPSSVVVFSSYEQIYSHSNGRRVCIGLGSASRRCQKQNLHFFLQHISQDSLHREQVKL